MDVKSAYDNIKRPQLYEKIRKYGVLTEPECQLIKFLHKKIHIKKGDKEVRIEKGVIQGMITSPGLFNIYMIPLANKLEVEGHKAIIYADDMLVIAKGRKEMKKIIKIVEEEMRSMGFEINKDKTKLMRISRRSSNK